MTTDGSDLMAHTDASPIPDAGFVNDLRQTYQDLGQPDPDRFDLAVDGVTYGLDVLNAALDPLNAVFGAAVGLIVDFIPPLKWVIDALAGDPAAIADASGTWFNVGTRMIQCGQQYDQALTAIPAESWGDDAATAYKAMGESYAGCLEGAGGFCYVVGLGVTAGGLLCASVRADIFQALTDLVIELVIEGAVALAAAVPSLGTSVEAFIALAEMHFALEAAEQAEKQAKLLARLSKSGQLMEQDARKAEKAAQDLHKLSEALENAGLRGAGITGDLRAFRDGVAKATDILGKLKDVEDKGKTFVWDPGSQLIKS